MRPLVREPSVAVRLIPLPSPPGRPQRSAQAPRRAEPRQLAADRPARHLSDRPRRRRRVRIPIAPPRLHGVSVQLWSGQIGCSLQPGFSRGFSRLTTHPEEAYWRIRRSVSIVAAGKIAARIRHVGDSADPRPEDAAFGASPVFPIVPWLAEDSEWRRLSQWAHQWQSYESDPGTPVRRAMVHRQAESGH